LRVTLGLLAIAHIYWKFYIRDARFDGWWNGLNQAGYPNWVVVYVLSGEFAGALLLIPGIFTRWVALYALPLMIGASQFWLVRKGFFFTAAGAEMPILWSWRFWPRRDWVTVPMRSCPRRRSRSSAQPAAQSLPNKNVCANTCANGVRARAGDRARVRARYAPIAWSRSAIRSTTSSIPMESLTTSGPAPALIRSSSDSWRCVVDAG
jgi:putative oxidoreductase